jgi:ferritin-like protein
MPENSQGYHESADALSQRTKDLHRAIASLMEELEAVDWYQQRVDAATDGALRDILAHNRDEEKEHASMVLEWIRRQDPGFDRFLRQYLFTEGSILGIEAAASEGGGDGNGAGPAVTTTGIGSLRRRR